MAITVREMRVAIGVEASAFDRGVTAIEGRLDKLGPKFQRMGVAMSAALTAPLAGLAARGIKVAGDLQQSLNVLAATSGATGDEMARLSKLAEQLGADIALPGTSAADAARAMLELSKGGLSIADTMESARAVLQLSAAAQIDNARAAEIVADSLAQFRLAGDRAVNVADLLAGAANASTGSIDEMAQALAQSGTAFKLLGVPIEDAVTSISLLAQAGIKGSDAGTSLKTALLRLNPTTKEAKAVMDKLKISFFDANGQFVGMQKAAAILQGALGRLSQQNQQTAISLIGGTDAMRALSIVAQAGADGFDAMRDKVSQAGSAAKLAAAQNDGLKGALDALQSSIDTALNAAVKPFLGDLERLAKHAADLAGEFGKLDTATQKSIVLGVAGAALAGPALLALGTLANAIRGLLPVLAALRVAAIATWAAVSGPLGPLILVVGAAAIAIAALWATNFGHIREQTAGAWEAIKGIFAEGAAAVRVVWTALTQVLQGEWGSALESIKANASRTMGFLTNLINPAALTRRIVTGMSQAAAEAERAANAATLFKEGRTMLPDVAAGAAASDAAFRQAKEKAAKAAAAAATAAKAAATKVITSAPHVPGLFDDVTKKAKEKLTPLQQQLHDFSRALREAQTEQAMLAAGASETVIRLANSFNLVTEKQRAHLAAVLQSNEATRKQRDQLKAADDRVVELARKWQAMTAKTLEGRLAIELFGKSLKSLNQGQRDAVTNAASNTRLIEKAEEAARKEKASADERTRLQGIANGLFKDAARTLDLLRDNSLENQISWDAWGKSIRDVNDAMNRHAVIAKAQSQRMEEMNKQSVAAAKQQLELFAQVMVAQFSMGPDTTGEQNAEALRQWADAMTTVGMKGQDLRRELALLRETSLEGQMAFDLMGVAFEDLPADIQDAIFGLADLQAQIDATAAKRDLLRDLAQSTQDVFMDAFGRLNEGFGGFFRGVIDGFERMLQQMAAQFLASQITNLIFGALGGGTPGIAGPIGALGGRGFGIPGRAMGGPVDAGRSYLVGERGPELFTPSQSGTIVPNGGDVGMRPIVVNMTVVTQDANSFRRSSGQVEQTAAMALRRAARRAGDE